MAKQYVNKQYGRPLFGKQVGTAPVSRTGVNPRAGMSYSVGVRPNGDVVHIYRDGERIVMHQHAAHAAPPHPASFGGMLAPDATDGPMHYDQQLLAALKQQVLASHQAPQHPTNDAQSLQHQAALAAAALDYQSRLGA